MQHKLIAALLMACLTWTVPGWAWGPEGHEIVGHIATHYLTPIAQEKVDKILGTKKISDYEVSSWPDIIRGVKEYEALYPKNGRWHYVDFDVAKPYSDEFELALPEDGNDIVSQIGRWQKELGAPSASKARKRVAISFLVHFVGDLHQPMHCAYRFGDMGGNMIPVNSFTGKHYSFDADTPMDYPPNLHSIWDEGMVNELLQGQKPRKYSRQIRKEITPEQIAKWQTEGPFEWAVDSYWRARKQAYRWTDGESLPFKWARPGMDLTSENYIESHLPVAREQLQKAGVRLAHILNTTLDPAYAPAPPPAQP